MQFPTSTYPASYLGDLPITLSTPYQSIMVHDGKIKFRIDVNNILFFKSEHVYVRIFLKNNQSVLYRNSLNDLFQQLDLLKFIQVHRSYVVNISAIKAFNQNFIIIGEHHIPISRNRRKEVLNALKDL